MSLSEVASRAPVANRVLHVLDLAAAHTARVAAVAVPVPDDDLVVRPAVVDHPVGVPAAEAVLDVVHRAAPDGGGVDAVAVPVAHEHGVPGAAVGDDPVGVAPRAAGGAGVRRAAADRARGTPGPAPV